MISRAERAVEQAAEQTGLADLGDDSWQEGLDRLVDSLQNEADLNDLGAALVDGELVGYLADRMRVLEWRKTHPEIVGVDVVPPIVIVGQGRTGTTILHELLAMDPASRVPLTWEVDRPVPPPETATYDTDPRIAEVDATLAGVDLVLPGFQQMHPMGAQLPQECVRITASDFRSMIFPTQYSVPSYARLVVARGRHGARVPMAPDVPGAPAVAASGATVGVEIARACVVPRRVASAEYPNALLVQTHRDPLRILASLSSLVARLRSLASDDVVGPSAPRPTSRTTSCSGSIARWTCARTEPFRPIMSSTCSSARSCRIPSRRFTRSTRSWGSSSRPRPSSACATFFAANPRDKHGTHTYTFAETGLNEGEWRERARRYQDYFDVPSESLG